MTSLHTAESDREKDDIAHHDSDHATTYSYARTVKKSDCQCPQELAQARATIDNIDAALIHILAERFKCTQMVGYMKARLDLPPSDPQREKEQVARLRQLAQDSGLDPVFAEKFLRFIVDEVIHHHVDIREEMSNVASRTGNRDH